MGKSFTRGRNPLSLIVHQLCHGRRSVTPNVHNEGRAPLLHAPLSIVGLGSYTP